MSFQMLYETPDGDFKLGRYESPEQFADTMLKLYGDRCLTMFAANVTRCKQAIMLIDDVLAKKDKAKAETEETPDEV